MAVLRGMSWHTITARRASATRIPSPGDLKRTTSGWGQRAGHPVNQGMPILWPQRWIPHDEVNAIACDRVVYIATDGGLGIITYEPYTLQRRRSLRALDEEWDAPGGVYLDLELGRRAQGVDSVHQ